jgi:phage host-nuclease inhibitor protein Gam
MEDFSMSIQKLRGNLAHATKIKAPGHAVCATVGEVEGALLDYNALMAEVSTLRREIADLKELAYERAPKLAAEEANKQIKPLKEEIERLRSELGYIANAKRHSFYDTGEFMEWAQSRARHALGQKPGELTIRKERT